MTNPDVMIPVPFAQDGLKNPINVTRQPDQDAQDATWEGGFPPVTMQRKEVGGLPPNGLDFNGVLHAVSADANHRQKGLSIEFNQDFATAIGGYPVGAKIRMANGTYVESTVAGNTNNPNSSMSGWKFVGAAANLSDLTSAATARTNLGLGTAATANVVNSVSSTDINSTLSAAMGKHLNDSKISVPVYIPANSNLNDYQSAGFYFNNLNVESATITNNPAPYSFSLLVERSAGVNQKLTTYGLSGNVTYTRGYYGGSWSSWKVLAFLDEVDTKLAKSSNLSDLTNVVAARDNLGLGTTATLTATTQDLDATVGRVVKVRDFGVGLPIYLDSVNNMNLLHYNAMFYSTSSPVNGWDNGIFQTFRGNVNRFAQIGFNENNNSMLVRTGINIASGGAWATVKTTSNTTVDSNGFIKNASPIVQLFADKIELNDEAQQQNIEFEKLGVGDYLIKNSTGLSNDGWYIETPKDANGNVLFSVIYTTLENGDISVKTYKKKFDFETVSIVADLDNPVDITENRWIDLRLQELPSVDEEQP